MRKSTKLISNDKKIKSLRTNGSYRVTDRPTKGLYLTVKNRGHNKYWFKRYRFRGKRRQMSLGSYPTVSLADAVTAAMNADRQRFAGDDPLELRAEQKRERERASQTDKTFKAVADDLIDHMSHHAPKTWREGTKKEAERIVAGALAPLHKYLCSEITPRQIFDIINPMRARTPSMADGVLKRMRTIFDWAAANELMDGKLNPAVLKAGVMGKTPLAKLFQTDNIEPEHEPRHAINWRKLPALMTTLEELAQPRKRYNTIEAATVSGLSVSGIYNAIGRGELKVYRPESIAGGHNKIEIEPADLFEYHRRTRQNTPIVDLKPGLPPVSVLLLKFLILNWTRFEEVHFMEWSWWQRDENLIIIPWQHMKSRNKPNAPEIRIDHVVPLNHRSVEVLKQLDEQRQRDGNTTSPYVFGHYRIANGSERMGKPISHGAVSKLLKRLLPPEEAKAVLHGMRTAGRSWGNAQRRMGLLNVTEEDLERSLAHVKGYGKTRLVRLYSRDDDEISPLVTIFDAWANYCLSARERKRAAREGEGQDSPSRPTIADEERRELIIEAIGSTEAQLRKLQEELSAMDPLTSPSSVAKPKQ